MKALIKYLFIICIVLADGYSLLFANAGATNATDSFGNPLYSFVDCPLSQSRHAEMISSAATVKERQHDLLLFVNEKNEEREEDEVSSSRKLFANGSFPVDAFFTPSADLLTSHQVIASSLNKAYSQSLSSRYLLLQVFRI